jgi:hypothetical protein
MRILSTVLAGRVCFPARRGLTIRYASFKNSSIFCRAREGSRVGSEFWLLRSSLRIGVRSVIVVLRDYGEKSMLNVECWMRTKAEAEVEEKKRESSHSIEGSRAGEAVLDSLRLFLAFALLSSDPPADSLSMLEPPCKTSSLSLLLKTKCDSSTTVPPT